MTADGGLVILPPVRTLRSLARRRPGGRWLVAALLLLLCAALVHGYRKRFIRALFLDGPAGEPPSLSSAPGGGLPRVERLRVVLLDGLGRHAARLPELDALCRRGLDLEVDVGFPTVSLPVQAVLWSGLTQRQSGLLFGNQRRRQPPLGSLPALIPGSVAIAESHPEIVHSFGFASAAPELDDGDWSPEEFTAAAREAVAGPARLAFVHLLRVDDAGHRQGAASPHYAEAAASAVRFAGELARQELGRADPGRIVVLADHGHLPAGGHGDAEASLRWVRACVVDPTPPTVTVTPGSAIQLVDLSRLLFDALGQAPPAGAVGRPLFAALAAPTAGTTLPLPSRGRILLAALAVLLGLLVGSRSTAGTRHRWLALAPWFWAANVGALLWVGAPTLSHNFVFRFFPWALLGGAAPGLLLLLLLDGGRLIRRARLADLAGPLGLPAGCTLAALALAGGERVVAVPPGPPLVAPFVPGLASAWLALLLSALLGLALLALVVAVRGGSGRPSPSAASAGSG